MVCTITELAKVYGVSKMTVSLWKLQGQKSGAKLLIDTEEPTNKEILQNKTKKGEIVKSEETAKPPLKPQKESDKISRLFSRQQQTSSVDNDEQSDFSAQGLEIDELQAEKLQEEIKKLKIDNEKGLFRIEVEKEKVIIEREKMAAEKEKIETEKKKLEKETQKIDLELKKLQAETKNYIHSDNVQNMMLSTLDAFSDVEKRTLLHLKNRNVDFDFEELRTIFHDVRESVVNKWEKLSGDSNA